MSQLSVAENNTLPFVTFLSTVDTNPLHRYLEFTASNIDAVSDTQVQVIYFDIPAANHDIFPVSCCRGKRKCSYSIPHLRFPHCRCGPGDTLPNRISILFTNVDESIVKTRDLADRVKGNTQNSTKAIAGT